MEDYKKTELTLYTYFRSSTTWRVRILLHHKKLAVDYKFIHLAKGEQKSEEFSKINPNNVNFLLTLGCSSTCSTDRLGPDRVDGHLRILRGALP